MADTKIKYPSLDTTALSITLAGLAYSSTAVAGRSSDAIDNTSNLDLDHVLSGFITTGTSPTTGNPIEIWVYGPRSISSGTPVYPDVIDGTDAAKTFGSVNAKTSALILAALISVTTTSNTTYDIAPISVAKLFGGTLPPYWGVFVVNGSGVALNATGGNHAMYYSRRQLSTA